MEQQPAEAVPAPETSTLRAYAAGLAAAKSKKNNKSISENPFPPASPLTVAFLRGFQTGSAG